MNQVKSKVFFTVKLIFTLRSSYAAIKVNLKPIFSRLVEDWTFNLTKFIIASGKI